MNPELRNAIDIEIRKSSKEMQDFLFGEYFKDTVKLIERVNKFTEDQAVSLELEVTMYLLGISDYPSLEEAFKGELGQGGQVANEATVRQAVKDVENYILSKAPKVAPATQVATIEVKPEVGNNTVSNIESSSKNLHEILYSQLEVNKTPNEQPSLNTTTEVKPETFEDIKDKVEEKALQKPLDFYREKVDEEDKKMKTL